MADPAAPGGPQLIFVYLGGDLEVRAEGESEGHYALANEMAADRGIELDYSANDFAGGVLNRRGDGSFAVTYWRGVDEDEPLRLRVEQVLDGWAKEHGHRLTY